MADVEKEDGRPVIVSQYGFRVREIEGKKYLTAMTKEEYDSLVEKKTGVRPTSYCAVAWPNCLKTDCPSPNYCSGPHYDSGTSSYYCACESP